MTDQPTQPDQPVDPTAPTPPVDPPAPQPTAPQPTAPQPPAPEAPAYAAPPPPPAANPYGGYTSAPAMGSQGGGQVPVGSRPYVEHHFGPVAGFGDRILPGIIDSLLMLIGMVPLILGAIVLVAGAAPSGYDAAGNWESGGPSGAAVGIAVLLFLLGFVLFVAIWIWNRLLKMGRTGQSVGKKMFGLKLINATTGEPIGAGSAFVRELIHGLANQVVYLSYLWMLWDPNRQTLGDLVAKSTVIKVPKA